MQVSIIIVNYNTKKLTLNCINSIFEYTKKVNIEVILVDNASTDGSIELFKNDSRIKFITNNTNLGFGKGNNLGFKFATGKYILLLNSDTLLNNNAIKIFFDTAESMDKTIACFGCLLKNADGKYSSSFGTFMSIGKTLLISLKEYVKFFRPKFYSCNEKDLIKQTPFFVDLIVGADLFIRRNVIENLGLFDPTFFMYYEEADLQRRYAKAGYKMMIISGPEIIHLEGQSSYKKLSREILEIHGLFIYLKKWNNSLSYYIFRAIYLSLRISVIINPKYKWKEKIAFFKKLLFI